MIIRLTMRLMINPLARDHGPDNCRPMIMMFGTTRRPPMRLGGKRRARLIIAANERAVRTRHVTRSVIIVGVDGSAEAEAAAAWAVREAELR